VKISPFELTNNNYQNQEVNSKSKGINNNESELQAVIVQNELTPLLPKK